MPRVAVAGNLLPTAANSGDAGTKSRYWSAMEKQLVFPMAFYVLYIWALAVLNFRVRNQAVKNKQIHVSYFKAFRGEVPEQVTVFGRHYDNQFQLPLLFLIVSLAHLVLKQAGPWTLVLAWAFVISRMGHTWEHLGKNRVLKRVLWFTSGWILLVALWAQLSYFAL